MSNSQLCIYCSFKERGALNALLNLSDEEKSRGVIAISAGNHAQGMAHQGLKLGIPVTVLMPVHAPLVKVSCCTLTQYYCRQN